MARRSDRQATRRRGRSRASHVPAVADHVPMRRFALELHRLPAREGQIGSVPGAARTLAVAHWQSFIAIGSAEIS